MGDYNSAQGKRLFLNFEKCEEEFDTPDAWQDGSETPDAIKKCKPDAFIKNWLRMKYMVTLENDISF